MAGKILSDPLYSYFETHSPNQRESSIAFLTHADLLEYLYREQVVSRRQIETL